MPQRRGRSASPPSSLQTSCHPSRYAISPQALIHKLVVHVAECVVAETEIAELKRALKSAEDQNNSNCPKCHQMWSSHLCAPHVCCRCSGTVSTPAESQPSAAPATGPAAINNSKPPPPWDHVAPAAIEMDQVAPAGGSQPPTDNTSDGLPPSDASDAQIGAWFRGQPPSAFPNGAPPSNASDAQIGAWFRGQPTSTLPPPPPPRTAVCQTHSSQLSSQIELSPFMAIHDAVNTTC